MEFLEHLLVFIFGHVVSGEVTTETLQYFKQKPVCSWVFLYVILLFLVWKDLARGVSANNLAWLVPFGTISGWDVHFGPAVFILTLFFSSLTLTEYDTTPINLLITSICICFWFIPNSFHFLLIMSINMPFLFLLLILLFWRLRPLNCLLLLILARNICNFSILWCFYVIKIEVLNWKLWQIERLFIV